MFIIGSYKFAQKKLQKLHKTSAYIDIWESMALGLGWRGRFTFRYAAYENQQRIASGSFHGIVW